MIKKIQELICMICKRPGMYVGSSSFNDVVIYISGYFRALSDFELVSDNAWQEWISSKFNIWSTAWSWDRIVLHHYKSENKAIKALPDLFAEYFHDIETLGEETIIQKHKDLFSSGERVPAYTDTISKLGNK